MRRRTLMMFVVTAVVVVLWALQFVPAVGISADLGDFFGGVAIGLAIGATITAIGERGST